MFPVSDANSAVHCDNMGDVATLQSLLLVLLFDGTSALTVVTEMESLYGLHFDAVLEEIFYRPVFFCFVRQTQA
jgi:hypothetical protein